MPPKTTFTKADVLQAAVDLISESSLGGITARNIATKLGSSTAPVYSHYENIDDLTRDAIREINKLLLEYVRTPYTNISFLNQGVGLAVFAREHSQLYRAIFLDRNDYHELIEEFFQTLRNELPLDKECSHSPEDKYDSLLMTMWTFTHGLASLICAGLCRDDSNENIIRTLYHVGKIMSTHYINPIEIPGITFTDDGRAHINE